MLILSTQQTEKQNLSDVYICVYKHTHTCTLTIAKDKFVSKKISKYFGHQENVWMWTYTSIRHNEESLQLISDHSAGETQYKV